MKKSNRKKAVAVIVLLSMLLGLLPATAFAMNDDNTGKTVPDAASEAEDAQSESEGAEISEPFDEGGKTYKAAFSYNQKYGYYIDPDAPPTITLINAESPIIQYSELYDTVEAVHDWQFKDITWNGYESAKANYVFAGDESHTESVDCVVEKDDSDPYNITYTATVSAEDSLDGEEHTDSKSNVTKWNLFIQGVHVTGENYKDVLGNGTVSFDPDAVKIILNNAKIEISRREDGDDNKEYGIRSNLGDGKPEFGDKNLTIELIGENTISDSTDQGGTEKYGIFVSSTSHVTYTGGSLNIIMDNADTATAYRGIEHRQPVVVDGAKINIDIDGSASETNGIRLLYSNTLSLKNNADMSVYVKTGYAFDNNVRGNGDLDVADGSIFEAFSEGPFGAFHGHDYIQLTDATKELGAEVNEEATRKGRTAWDKETDLSTYKYLRIPGLKFVTINFDLGKDHEKLAASETLHTAINKNYNLEVIGTEGSVVKINVPDENDSGYKNTLGKLLLRLRVALAEGVGNSEYDFIVYDEDKFFMTTALNPLDHYSSYSETREEYSEVYESGVMPRDGQTIYCLWAEPVRQVNIEVKAAVCGTEVTAKIYEPTEGSEDAGEIYYDESTQDPRPEVSVNTESVSLGLSEDGSWERTWWVDTKNIDQRGFELFPDCYVGQIVGDKEYVMFADLECDFGYYMPEDVEFTTSSGVVNKELSHGWDITGHVFITVKAEHKAGEPVEENRVEATYERAGSYDEVIYCVNHDTCGKEISRITRTIPKKDKVHNITFDLNGGAINGSTEPIVIQCEEGEVITIPGAPTREGYTFLYWQGSKYYPGDKYTVKGAHTFKAVWKKGSADGKTVPATGDANMPYLWSMLLICAVTSLIMIRKRRSMN